MKQYRYYKAACLDGWDFYTGNTINYRDSIGELVKCPDQSSNAVLCSTSVLHASEKPLGVFIGAKIPCSLYVVEGIPVCEDSEKSGFKEFDVLYEVPQLNLNKIFGFNYLEASNPIHPFKIEPPRISEVQLDLLQDWNSVMNSVRNSVRDSVMNSVWNSVMNSVKNSVWNSVMNSVWDSTMDSVWDSVWDSVMNSVVAYTGSLFPKIEKWQYCDNIHTSGYPFQSVVGLWKMGIVPSYDGKIWRLHTKNGIVWEEKL